MAKKRTVKKRATSKATSEEPSKIIQIGVVFIIIAAFFLLGYTLNVYR